MSSLLNAAPSTRPTRLYIDGRWCEGACRRVDELFDPATEAPLGAVAHAEDSDIDRAIDAARRALPAWRATTLDERGAVLRRAALRLAAQIDAAALALTSEQGKPLAESRAELARAVDTLLWHATHGRQPCLPHRAADGSTIIRPEPIGVIAAFTPWNYPAVIIARKLSAALIAGCTVVLKAAEATPTIATMIVAALAEAGLPGGVVNLLFGDPPAISARLIASPEVRALSFTGSTAVGKQLATQAGATLVRCVLELGGHAPVLVCADADIEAAACAIAAYKFECAGQSCNAPSRVYVHASVYERFVCAMTDIARAIVVGDGRDERTIMGPLSTARRVDAIERLTADARAHGGRIHVGGARLPRRGFFFPPTVLTDVGEGAALLREEPFGPLLPIWPFENFEAAIERANSTPYGLAAYVFTRDQRVADAASAALEAGCVGVNELSGVPPDVGIAGVKDSGYGYEGGVSGIEAFLSLKAVRGSAKCGDLA